MSVFTKFVHGEYKYSRLSCAFQIIIIIIICFCVDILILSCVHVVFVDIGAGFLIDICAVDAARY